MKTIIKYARHHKYKTISLRLNYFELIEFNKMLRESNLTASEYLKKLIFKKTEEKKQ